MISIWSKISRYWQTTGWLYLLLGALAILGICWLMSAHNNRQGTYDRYEVISKQYPKHHTTAHTHYFPQSIDRGDPLKPQYQNKSKVPTQSKGEEICRATLQQIFQQPFPNVRPDFLFNSVTGENLELDMYNKHYGLAVEYNGQQHYKFNSFMHGGSKDKFYGQKYRDQIKRDVCKKLGIRLIEVPYTVKHKDIPNYLVSKLRQHGFVN